jgi:hypothetical protein
MMHQYCYMLGEIINTLGCILSIWIHTDSSVETVKYDDYVCGHINHNVV